MNKTDAEAQYAGLKQLLGQQLERMDDLRREHIKAKVAWEREQDNFARAIRDLKMTYAQDPAIQGQADPSTGKVNKEWTGWLIEKAVERDPEFTQATGLFYETQEAYFAAEIGLHGVGEKVSSTKAEMILFGALLKYVASPE